MLFRSKWASFILGLLIVFFAGCTGSTTPSNTQSNPTNNKLVVFVSGLASALSDGDIAQNNGYGSDPVWQGIQAYLQGKDEFKGAQFMTFSYRGFNADGTPVVYPCTDTFNSHLSDDEAKLDLQITQYLKGHPNTDVYIVSHSLGGVVTFGYMAQLIETTHSNALSNLDTRLGTLKGIAILDSPLGGVTNESNYLNAIIGKAFTCDWNKATKVDFTSIGELQTLFNTSASPIHQGETGSIFNAFMGGKYIPNQQVATDATNSGVKILVAGNENDILWRPEVCNSTLFHINMPDFLSTEYLQEPDQQVGGGTLYSRSFLSGQLSCNAVANNSANHSDVLNRTDVEQAIWETFTGKVVDVLNSVNTTVVQQPTPTPTPTPSLDTVDWSNHTYAFNNACDMSEPQQVTLQNGVYGTNPETTVVITLRGTSFGDVVGDNTKQAAILFDCRLGNFDLTPVFVFTGDANNIQLLGIIKDPKDWYSASNDPYIKAQSVQINNEQIQVSGIGYSPNTPHCCPNLNITKTYIWNGSAFILQNVQTSPYNH